MELFLKRAKYVGNYGVTLVRRVKFRIFTIVLLVLLGLISALGVQVMSVARVTATQEAADQYSCPVKNADARQLIKTGTDSYENGQYAGALDCWQRAERFPDKNIVTISKINQAQALQSMGLYPRACATLLQVFFEPGDKKLQGFLLQAFFKPGDKNSRTFGSIDPDCRLLDQLNLGERNSFVNTLIHQRYPDKHNPDSVWVTGLRSLGDSLRVLGNLELSQAILQAILSEPAAILPQDEAAVKLSLGNTAQALNKKERDAYTRHEEQTDSDKALRKAYEALDYYKQAAEYEQATKATLSIIQVQARLNLINMVLEVEQWLKWTEKRTQEEWWPPNLSRDHKSEIQKIKQQADRWSNQVQNYVSKWQEIGAHIKELPNKNLAAIYTRINFARSLTCLLSRTKAVDLATTALPTAPNGPFACLNHYTTMQKSESTKISDSRLFQFQYIESLLKSLLSDSITQDKRARAYAHGHLGMLYKQSYKQESDYWSKARDQLQLAASLAESVNSPEIAYQWLWELGRLFKDRGEKKNAIAAYKAAWKILQNLRSDIATINPDIQFSFREAVEPVYREFVDLLLPIASASSKESAKASENPEQQAREVIESLELAELSNFLQEACSTVVQKKIDTILEKQDPTAAILYPIILEDRIEVILKLPKKEETLYRYTTALPKLSIENTLKELRYSLEQPYFSSITGKPAAIQVYDWLIRGAEEKHLLDEKKIKTLLFVLDGALRNIPMAALYDSKNNKYLIEKYAIAVAPSLQLLVPKVNDLSNPTKNALVAGLSVAPDKKEKEFGQLYPESEVGTVRRILGEASPPLLGQNFSRETLQKKLESASYKVVHLATHGQFSFNRNQTFIITALGKSGFDKVNIEQLKTSLLPGKDRTSIDLLVLSACETATGDDRDTLGIAGVAVRTGSRSTLAPLWSVEEQSTEKFMEQFYSALTGQEPLTGKRVKKQTKAEALRTAQLYLLHKPSAYKPSHWAPYILVGDWR